MTNNDEADKKYRLAREIIREGSAIVGDATSAAAGAYIGAMMSGAPGAVIGAVAGGALQRTILQFGDFAEQKLSHNESVRAGAAGTIALLGIKRRLDDGEALRDDGFFERAGSQWRSSHEQIFEGVLLKARDSHEEKKAILFGKFYENLVFDNNISPGFANWALSIGEKLTYRQFCLLAVVGQVGLFNARDLRDKEHSNPELEALKREEMDLHTSDLGTYGLVDDGGQTGQPDFGFIDKLTVLGQQFYALFALPQIPKDDLEDLKALLRQIGYEL